MRKLFNKLLIILVIMLTNAPLIQANTHTPSSIQNKIKKLPRNQQHGTKVFRIGRTIYHIHIQQPKPPWYLHPNKQQINKFKKQIIQQSLRDINQERIQHGKKKIQLNFKLMRLANLRANQVSQRFSHYSRKGTPMTSLDAKSVGLSKDFQGSENIASSSLGRCTEIDDPKKYTNYNGKDMANMSNDGMMNYDKFEHNGHRKNILSNDNTLVGIGASYNPKKKTFYLAEDFGNKNPNNSEDIYNNQPIDAQDNSAPNAKQRSNNRKHLKSSWQRFLNWLITIIDDIISFIEKFI